MKKKIALSISAISLVLMTGCGSSSSSNNNSTQTTTPQKSVTVLDGYIIGANVCDANNVCQTTNENGIATAAFDENSALVAKGGYIDVNYNHQIDENDTKLPDTFTLKTPAGKSLISPITDLIANGADKAKLAQILGVDEDSLCTDPIATNNIELAKAIQIVYVVKAKGKETDFINKINTYGTQTVEENQTLSENTQNNVSNTTESQIPDFGKVVTTDDNSTATANETENTLETFADLAKSVLSDDEAKSLIDTIVTLDATTPAELEMHIAEAKQKLANEFEAMQEEAENNQEAMQEEAENNQEVAQEELQETNTSNTTTEETTSNTSTESALPQF